VKIAQKAHTVQEQNASYSRFIVPLGLPETWQRGKPHKFKA
jgi:hypothetical protein